MRHFPYGFVSSFSSTIRLSSVFNFRLPSIDSLASMSAPRRSVIISLSFIIAMIATSILQNYKKVIEYGWFFSKNLKLSLKYLQLSEIMPIFAHRTMDVFHLLGLGCPRSEELSGSWRLFFYACWDG